MKVMHFTPYFPPERLGGVGEFVADLHGALIAAGHESLVVTCGKNSEANIFRIAKGPLGWFFKTMIWTRKARQCDIVHCQAGEAFPLVLLLSLGKRKTRILTTFHVSFKGISASHQPYSFGDRVFARGLKPFLYRTLISWIHRFLDWMTIRLSDAINTISKASAQEIVGDEASAKIIYCGLPPLEEVPDTSTIEPVELLYVGAGGHRKRVNALPFILERVRQERAGARLRIIGFEMDQQPELKSLLAEHGLLPYVDYVGFKKSSELPPFYSSAQALVVPSAYEGLPLVMLEAMQCGLPVVATRVSGHPEVIVDGENGFLVDLDRPVQMAERCLGLLERPALRARIGEAARRTIAERFTLERELCEYLALYERLADQRGQS